MIKPQKEGVKYYFFYPKPKSPEELNKLNARDRKKEKGRITIAAIYDPEESSLSFGVAQCSKKDIFVKETGRIKAVGRARHKQPILRKHLNKDDKIITIFIENAKMVGRVIDTKSIANNTVVNKHEGYAL